MLFLALLALTILSGILWYEERGRNRYRLDILTLIAGGGTIMFLVDSIYRYVDEGVFLELSLDTLLLSLILVVSAILLWGAVLLLKVLKLI